MLFAEVRDERGYVKHCKAEIALIFAAMRLRQALKAKKVKVRYVGFEDEGSTGALRGEVRSALADGDLEGSW